MIKHVLLGALSSLSLLSIAHSAQPLSTQRCMNGCDASAQCESLIDMTQYQLWSVAVNRNGSTDYQIEGYGIPGTPQHPGHLIWVSHGYIIPENPTGACRIEMLDGISQHP